MTRAMIVTLALLGACAPGADLREGGAVPAPSVADVSIRIGAAQSGQIVHVPVGQRFAVELVGVPTAGYVWAPVNMPSFLTARGQATGNTTEAQSQPGFAGGSHWEVFAFEATAAGTAELVFEQRRPWETNEPANSTFRVTITAH